MISRRLIRIKVLQVLYAFHNTDDTSLVRYEKELFKSIDKSYELYHLIFLLLTSIQRYASDRIEIARNKKLPTPEDLNPNTRFIDNKLLNQILNNDDFNNFVKANKLSWADDKDLIKRLFLEIKEAEFYKKYMSAPESGYKYERSVVIQSLERIIMRSELFHQTIEDRSIYWNDDVEHVMTMVVKTLDSFKESDGNHKKLMPLFKNQDDMDFAKQLFRCSLIEKDYFNEVIQKHTSNWELDRIAFMDILIMHMAMAEMTSFPSIPLKVSLNEYIDLAKQYSTEKSGIFVNGVLDKSLITLKKDAKINKIGRGLIEN